MYSKSQVLRSVIQKIGLPPRNKNGFRVLTGAIKIVLSPRGSWTDFLR